MVQLAGALGIGFEQMFAGGARSLPCWHFFSQWAATLSLLKEKGRFAGRLDRASP